MTGVRGRTRMGRLGIRSVGVHARGLGKGERGGYGRVEDGIADRVEGRHGMPGDRTLYLCRLGLIFWPLLGLSSVQNGRMLAVDFAWRGGGHGSLFLDRARLDSTVVLVVSNAHRELRHGRQDAVPLLRCFSESDSAQAPRREVRS